MILPPDFFGGGGDGARLEIEADMLVHGHGGGVGLRDRMLCAVPLPKSFAGQPNPEHRADVPARAARGISGPSVLVSTGRTIGTPGWGGFL